MGRTLSILVFAAAVLAFLTAILVTGPVIAVVPLAALAAAVFLILLRHRNGYIAGGMLAVFSIVALIMSFGGISGEGETEVGSASNELGQSMAIASAVVAAGALLGLRWGQMEPPWMPVVWLVVLLVGLGLAFGLNGDLGNPVEGINYVTGLVVLAGGVPALLQAIRDEPDE